MVKYKKFKIIKEDKKSHDNDDNLVVNINIKEKKPKNIQIGKFFFDEDTLTRVAIVKLSKLGYQLKKICTILKVSRMLAWKWSNFEKFKEKGFRESKFTDDEKKFLCDKADGKMTGVDGTSSRNLKKDFCEKFNKNISHSTINNILNKGLTKPLKVVNTFALTELHKEKRKRFVQDLKNDNINTDRIFFTDECRVVLIPKLNRQNNYIRYNKDERKNRFNPEIQKKRENQTPKFDQSVMIAGGVCKYGLSNLVFCSGTQNNFSYKQFLLFMKKDMLNLKKDNNLEENLIFQQDNAACHTSRESKDAIEILFGKDYIEWPPNSPDLSPIENVWAIIKEKLEKRVIKNLDDLRVNILDIWAKFPVSLCEKICDKFNDKIKYVEKYGGQKINKELLEKIKKEKKENKIFVPINNDNEWISIKRDNKFRIVFNDKIVKTIKSRFIKQINDQKKNKLIVYDMENSKLKKNDKNITKFMNKEEYNKNREEKRNIIEEYYNKMEIEIKKMSEIDFVTTFLNKENNENIKNLMSTNLSNNFQLNEVSTNISSKLDEIIEDKKDEDYEKIDGIINKAFNKWKINRVKDYINNKITIKDFFPEPKKLKRNDSNAKVNEIESQSQDIFNILSEISNLNEEIKKYHKKNKEKGSEIGVEADIEENEEEEEINMEIE